jgi:hypothetical protein
MFKAEDSVVEPQQEKEMTIKTVDRTFLQGDSTEVFRVEIKNQAACDQYERSLLLRTNSVIGRAI